METSMTSKSQSVPSQKNFKNAVNSSASQLTEQVTDWTSAARDAAGDYIKTGTEYVAKNPVQGAGIAAAAGAVIGCLLTLAFTKD